MSFIENYQSRKNLLANNLQNQEVDALGTEGFTSLINKVGNISTNITDGILLYTNTTTLQVNDTIQLYALSLKDGQLISGETIYFLKDAIQEKRFYGEVPYIVYTVTGDGQITLRPKNQSTPVTSHIVQGSEHTNIGAAGDITYKREDSKIYKKVFYESSYQQLSQFNGSLPFEIWVDTNSIIVENTFIYGNAQTNEYGIATISRQCTNDFQVIAQNDSFISNQLNINIG